MPPRRRIKATGTPYNGMALWIQRQVQGLARAGSFEGEIPYFRKTNGTPTLVFSPRTVFLVRAGMAEVVWAEGAQVEVARAINTGHDVFLFVVDTIRNPRNCGVASVLPHHLDHVILLRFRGGQVVAYDQNCTDAAPQNHILRRMRTQVVRSLSRPNLEEKISVSWQEPYKLRYQPSIENACGAYTLFAFQELLLHDREPHRRLPGFSGWAQNVLNWMGRQLGENLGVFARG